MRQNALECTIIIIDIQPISGDTPDSISEGKGGPAELGGGEAAPVVRGDIRPYLRLRSLQVSVRELPRVRGAARLVVQTNH